MKNNAKHEVIFVLVNKGFTDDIMDAARAKGARGGTILTARTSANQGAEKNYGIAITPDKELMMILVDGNIKNKVISSIYKVAGIETKAMGIIWSVPADNIIGISKANKTKQVKAKK